MGGRAVRGGESGRGSGAGQDFGERRRVHRAAAISYPISSEQFPQPLTKPVGVSGESQAIVAYVARAARVDQCTGCAACESACLQGAVRVDRFATVDESLCRGCGECVDVCAFDVLALQPR